MDKKGIVEQYTRTNEASGIDAVSHLLADDLKVYANVFAAPKNKADEMEFSRSLRAQCAEVHMDILSLSEEGDGVRRIMRAHGVMKSGWVFETQSSVLFLFNEHGQVREMRETIDMGALAEGAKGVKT